MNSFLDNLQVLNNIKTTEKGAAAYKSTLSKVYDLFAFGGAYRNRTDDECVKLFREALKENETLAVKCLFYLRDVRGGQGERRFFRVCFRYLCVYEPEIALRNLEEVSEFGRWDDLIYTALGTQIQVPALEIIKRQLTLDVQCKTPSLLAKWLPSENASSKKTKEMGGIIRRYLGFTHKEYRRLLSSLREKIKIVEALMSANRWEDIDFSKIPSRAGLIYRNAFARRDIIAKKYEDFVKNEEKEINAKDLYPYDILREVRKIYPSYTNAYFYKDRNPVQRAALQKMWENLPDYFDGKPAKMIAVVDTSGSMTWAEYGNVNPIDVATSLGLYCAEKNTGEFANKVITFSTDPEFIEISGKDILEKAGCIYENSIIADTCLHKTFDLIKKAAKNARPEDVPETLVIISDMEIDDGIEDLFYDDTSPASLMEKIREDWELDGLTMPKLVYWNVNSRNQTILDLGPNVSCVSGCSPIIFEMVLSGKNGKDLMLSKLLSDRYENIK